MTDTAESLDIQPQTPSFEDLFAELGATFDNGRTRPLEWRAKQLRGIERMMDECEDEFLKALHADLGKHPQEAWMAEIAYVAGAAAYARKRLKRWTRNRRVPTPVVAQPGKSWVQPEPLGTVLIIGAWNYPLQLVLAGLAAAIAAGNTAVLKPSELAPATSAAIARLVPEYLDGEAVKVVEGSVPETTALLELPFDHILYTGGGAVGRVVMRAAAEHLTPVTLELGGKSPCVVLPDANLETAARRITWGKYSNAGQTCVAPDYILTDADTAAKLVPLIAESIHSMFGDDPQQSDSYGRIVNDRHFERLAAMLDGAEIPVGGNRDAATRYIEPTVITGVTPESPAMQEEIFGPILPVVEADDLDAAMAYIRKGDKPLSAYIFTSDRNAEKRFLAGVSCGNACVNDTMMFMAVEELPFGGVGASGMGAYSGEHGFLTFSHMKAVMRRGVWPDVAVRYAPFSKGKWNLLRKLR